MSPIYNFKPTNFIKKRATYKPNVRVILYAILIVAMITSIFVWQKKLVKINADSKAELTQIDETTWQNLKNGLSKSDKNYADLMLLGKKYLDKNEFGLALLYFEKVSKDQPDYRDAAFYAGYTYLKINQNETFNYKLLTLNSLENSRENFLKAKSIDSLYAPTYEFLAYVYKQLDDDKNAEVCYNRFKELSK